MMLDDQFENILPYTVARHHCLLFGVGVGRRQEPGDESGITAEGGFAT